MRESHSTSVCVPAFNRPEMMKELIASFLKQSYSDKELVIADDSTNDDIFKLVTELREPTIKYHRNSQNLGYCRNLLRAMELASGDYIVLMGDDDAFLSPHALSRYASVFEENLTVGYVYSNQIQFSSRIKIQDRFQFFPVDKRFSMGEDSMRNIWTTSVFIPGVAIRNDISLRELYPVSDMLFPQVELIGHIINRCDSYGIAEYLIAGRAHREQLGFYAIKGERIVGSEKHGTIELFGIFQRLSRRYHFEFTNEFLVTALIDRYAFMILKERTIVGRSKIRANYKEFCRMSPAIAASIKLKLSYMLAMLLPSSVINFVRLGSFLVRKERHRASFSGYERELRESIRV
jgi:glycosyltransferase involved in cell wall biosynthesis